MMDPHSPHGDIAAKRERYREELEKNGHSMVGRELPMARLLAVADTREEAETIARNGAGWLVKSYIGPQHKGVGDLPAFGLGAGDGDPVERYLDGIVLWGTPAEVADEILRLREEMFLDYLLCAPLSHGSFIKFTDEVMPRIL